MLIFLAEVAESVDALVSGTSAARRVSSSLILGTKDPSNYGGAFFISVLLSVCIRFSTNQIFYKSNSLQRPIGNNPRRQSEAVVLGIA